MYNILMTGGNVNLDGMAPADQVSVPLQTASKDTALYSWDALSFEKKAKDYRWYLIAAVIILVAIGLLIWQRDWFTIAILVIVSAILFWYVRTQRPKTVTYKITPLGIMAGERLYSYSEIHSYWLVYNEKVQNLYFAFTRKYLPTLVVGLGKADPVRIKSILSRRLPEQAKRTENLVDKLVRIIGI